MRLLVNTAELRHAVGAEKLIEGSVEPAEVGVDDARLEPGAPVLVDLRLESVNDGVLVTGTVSARWRGECRRCLTAAGDAAVALLDERYQYTVTDPNAFPIDNRLRPVATVLANLSRRISKLPRRWSRKSSVS